MDPNSSGKHVAVIGSGFAGLAAACCLAKEGCRVSVFEKNETIGGRARVFEHEGFVFDMGPSWYWMPDVFEDFFSHFGKSAADFYKLLQLEPSYSIVFDDEQVMDVPADMDSLFALFENYEGGSAKRLKKFLEEAAYKYKVGINDLVYKPSHSLMEFADLRILKGIVKMGVFQSYHKYVRKFFKDSRLLQLMEFPLLFLGAVPQNTPALYSLMNYAGLSLGTWYPMGGMHKVIDAIRELAESLGVNLYTNAQVERIVVENGHARGVYVNEHFHAADAVIGGADYHHIEQQLLEKSYRRYDEQYWDQRVMAPSCLIFYLGVDRKVDKLQHHNLFFDRDFSVHSKEIYEEPQWPSDPLFYVCCPSKTDPSVAPAGKENLFVLIPIAPGLEDSEPIRERYYTQLMQRLEKYVGHNISREVVFKRSYAVKDFEMDYHAYKGNGYGLANTLMQTAILKPAMRNPKVKGLYFAGQLTVPGPGMPPSLISGQVAAQEVLKFLEKLPAPKVETV
jgi:phytoene desaturase